MENQQQQQTSSWEKFVEIIEEEKKRRREDLDKKQKIKEELEKQVNQGYTKEQVIERAAKQAYITKQKQLKQEKQKIKYLKEAGYDPNNYTEQDYTDARHKAYSKEGKEAGALSQLKKDKLRIAKRMAYEKLVKDVRDIETRKMLLEKDDKHVEQVLKQFGIKIEIGV